MKKIILICYLFCFSVIGFSQSLSPTETNEFCPKVAHTFIFTLPGNNWTSITASAVSYATISQQVSGISYNSSTDRTTCTLKVTFDDEPVTQIIRLTYQKSPSPSSYTDFSFERIKSIASNITPTSLTINYSSNTAALCSTTPIAVNFSAYNWKNNITATTFGSITEYEYSLPTGWSLNSGTAATGPTDLKLGTNNVTITPDLLNFSTVLYRATNKNCGNNLNPGPWTPLTINRPALDLKTSSGSKSISISCGETDTKTFTVANGITNGCITYTWRIANKGWKYNGSVPTSDVVTTTPSIQLVSNDNNTAPPQNVIVEMSSGSAVLTSTVAVSYLAPSVALPFYGTQFGLDCSAAEVNATLTNAPVNSYNFSWSTINGYTINSGTSPQSTGTTTSATIQQVGVDADLVKVTLQASCGNIESNEYQFGGCYQWNNLSVDYLYSLPSGSDPIYAYCSTTDQMPEVTGFEWYYFDGSTYTFAANSTSLSFWNSWWPCGSNSLWVRAMTYYGTSALKYVGDFEGECFYRKRNNDKEVDIKVFPNPFTDVLNIQYKPENEECIVRIADLQGNMQMQHILKYSAKEKGVNKINTLNISKLRKGKYILVVKDGKKTFSRIIEKK